MSTSVFSLLIFLSGKLSWRMYQRPSGLSSQYQAMKHKTFYRQKPNVRHHQGTSRPVCLSERCCPSDRAPGGQTGGLTMDLHWWVSVSWDRGTVWVCLQCREERKSSCQQASSCLHTEDSQDHKLRGWEWNWRHRPLWRKACQLGCQGVGNIHCRWHLSLRRETHRTCWLQKKEDNWNMFNYNGFIQT